jgi:hypothetical protein
MKNTNENGNDAELAQWQKISGLTVEREKTMSDDERDDGIRKLLAEVERMAGESFARGERAPAGERTLFWDPLERICRKLEISRVKLSAYSRELTGMRAHEVSDRILAKKNLLQAMEKRILGVLKPEFEKVRGHLDRTRVKETEYRASWCKSFWKLVKLSRTGIARARCAAELGFANPSRLSRACLLAHGMSIEELESIVLVGIVQKFFDGIREEKASPQSTQSAQRNGGDSKEESAPAETFADQVVREAVADVMKGRASA